MSQILSQPVVDTPNTTPAVHSSRWGRSKAARGHVTNYDFRRPDRVSKDLLRALHFMHERMAVNMATSLSAFLRCVTEVSIGSVEQFIYSEFLMSLPDPTAFYAINLAPLGTLGALEVDPSIAFAMVDRMLGGSGTTPPLPRGLSEIELNVLDAVATLLLDHATETWRPVADAQFRIHARETRPQMLQVMGSNEVVVVMSFDIRVAQARGAFKICIPAHVIETVEEKMVQPWSRTRRDPTPAEREQLLANLKRVPLPVTAMLGTRLAARELLALESGDVIALSRPASQPVDIEVGRVRRFFGRLTTSGSRAVVVLDGVAADGRSDQGAVQ